MVYKRKRDYFNRKPRKWKKIKIKTADEFKTAFQYLDYVSGLSETNKKSLDWKNITKNHDFFKIVKYPKLPWNKDFLAIKMKDLNFNTISHLDYRSFILHSNRDMLNWSIVTKFSTWDFMIDYHHLPWKWKEKEVAKQSIHIALDHKCGPSAKITCSYMSLNTFTRLSKHPEHWKKNNLCWSKISKGVPINYVVCFPKEPWDMAVLSNVISIENELAYVAGALSHLNWDMDVITKRVLYRNCYDSIVKFPGLKWNKNMILREERMSGLVLRMYPEFNWNWPTLTMKRKDDFVIMRNPDFPWDFKNIRLSENFHFIIIKYPERPWNLTEDYIKSIDKDFLPDQVPLTQIMCLKNTKIHLFVATIMAYVRNALA